MGDYIHLITTYGGVSVQYVHYLACRVTGVAAGCSRHEAGGSKIQVHPKVQDFIDSRARQDAGDSAIARYSLIRENLSSARCGQQTVAFSIKLANALYARVMKTGITSQV
jgi:hypothetical protein